MCGRTCCALCRETYQKATSYYNESKQEYEKPWWNEVSNNGKIFTPSTNVAPSEVTPVLISGDHFEDSETSRILQPMMWGLIPRWHQGDLKYQKLSTNNCRFEGLLASKLYEPCMRKGKRCVIICEGFYEWHITPSGAKQPYFFYSSQPQGVRVEDSNSWLNGQWSERTGWIGPRLLYMAGLFDVWHSETDELIYSYSVITMDSNESMSWCHHRMPAILSSEIQIQNWLDFEGVNPKEAVKLLQPAEALSWHPVSIKVNKATSKGPEINQRICPISRPGSRRQTFMDKWLKSGFEGLDKNENENSVAKRIKLDEEARNTNLDTAVRVKADPYGPSMGTDSYEMGIKPDPDAVDPDYTKRESNSSICPESLEASKVKKEPEEPRDNQTGVTNTLVNHRKI